MAIGHRVQTLEVAHFRQQNNICALREHNCSDSDLQTILFTDEQTSDITIHCSDTYCNHGVQFLIHHVTFSSAHVLIPCNINFAKRNDTA